MGRQASVKYCRQSKFVLKEIIDEKEGEGSQLCAASNNNMKTIVTTVVRT